MAIGVTQASRFLADAVAPLGDLTGDEDVIAFVQRLGWTLPSVPSGFSALQAAAAQLSNALAGVRRAGRTNDLQAFETSVGQLAVALGGLVGAVEALPLSVAGELPAPYLTETRSDPQQPASGIDGQIKKRLLDLLIGEALLDVSPTLRTILFVLGVVQETDFDADDSLHRPDFTLIEIDLDRLSLLVTDQAELLRQVYGWGTPSIDVDRLFTAIKRLASITLSQPWTTFPSDAFLAGVFPGVPIPDDGVSPMLAIPLVRGFGHTALSLGVMPAPQTSTTDPQALALRIIGAPDLKLDLPLSSTLSLKLDSTVTLDTGVGVLLRPRETPIIVANVEAAASSPTTGAVSLDLRRAEAAFDYPIFKFDQLGDLSIKSFFATLGLAISPADVSIQAGIVGGILTVSLGQSDGFLQKSIPVAALTAKLDLAVGWSKRRGLFITGSGGLEVTLPINQQLGPLTLKAVRLALQVDDAGLRLDGGVLLSVAIGPVSASVEGVGVQSRLRFRSGNLGPVDLGIDFKPPTGVGIAVNSGPISGGGFISFDPDAGRYSGALELSIYSVAVKAFGLIETKLPDGGKGFSFVIVISAEFTPIQLGLGFTLNAVGGLIGINRTVDGNGLANLVRAGASEELLFPKNLIANAPAIIRDLGRVFPAREGHFVFGPLAKLGWGTPTLIQAEIGIFLELPGPVLSLLGEVKCLLPKPEAALVKLNLSVSGQLDFPHRSFSMDASLHDSVINGFPVSGQMAMRLRWGEQSNFALSVGGFHPAFKPPPNFPKLQPMALELSRSASVSVTVSGFFAITSNTLQIGGQVSLHASGSGISFDANLSVKALFVFSPFSFVANIDASVKISFHGHGPSVHLSATLTGPSPWRVKGEVCVSILFWDACLRFDKTFGGDEQVTVPEIDPWLGSAAPGSEAIQGLRDALQDGKNWTALPPAGAFAAVSLGENSKTFVDPLGGFSVRQKAVPVETKVPIKRFGAAKAADPKRPGPIKFKLVRAALQTVPGDASQDVSLVRAGDVKDQFAAAQFFEMNDAKKLSAPSFEKYDAGYSLSSNGNNIRLGRSAPRAVDVRTLVMAADGTTSDGGIYQTPAAHVEGLATRSAVALAGATQGGTRKYVDAQLAQPFELPTPFFVLAGTADLKLLAGGPGPATRTEILILLDDVIAADPAKRDQVQIVPQHELAA